MLSAQPSVLVAFVLLLICRTATAVPPARPDDGKAQTIYYNNKPANAVGDYSFEFQTTNGITTKAAGNAYGAVGVIQYVSPEGIPITLTYTADENGYRPEGAHLPAMPKHVLRAQEYIRTHRSENENKSRRRLRI